MGRGNWKKGRRRTPPPHARFPNRRRGGAVFAGFFFPPSLGVPKGGGGSLRDKPPRLPYKNKAGRGRSLRRASSPEFAAPGLTHHLSPPPAVKLRYVWPPRLRVWGEGGGGAKESPGGAARVGRALDAREEPGRFPPPLPLILRGPPSTRPPGSLDLPPAAGPPFSFETVRASPPRLRCRSLSLAFALG